MSLYDQPTAPPRATSGFMVVALVVCSSFASGCASFAEKLSALCTTTPPVYGDEIPPQADFGHYPTHWDRWPCNELTIDRGHRPDEKAKQKPTDTGSTPGDTTGAENEMDNQGVPGRREDPNALPDDLFEPDRNAPLPNKTPDETPPPESTPEEPGLTPPDPNAPDAMPPDTAPPDAPTDAIPEVKPPAEAPEIPEDLFDDKKPAGVPPGHGSLGTDPLPTDAPEGDLVSDGPESNRQKIAAEKKPNVTPTGPKLGPATPRIESARRQSAVRRTSAIESPPPVKRDVFSDDESDGPALHAPATNRSSTAKPSAAVSPQSGTGKASSTRQAVVAPIKWPGDDDVQLVTPRVPDTQVEKLTSDVDRSARNATPQTGTARRANSSRRTVATDSRSSAAAP